MLDNNSIIILVCSACEIGVSVVDENMTLHVCCCVELGIVTDYFGLFKTKC